MDEDLSITDIDKFSCMYYVTQGYGEMTLPGLSNSILCLIQMSEVSILISIPDIPGIHLIFQIIF